MAQVQGHPGSLPRRRRFRAASSQGEFSPSVRLSHFADIGAARSMSAYVPFSTSKGGPLMSQNDPERSSYACGSGEGP
jgi:hypothetical protein